MLLYLLNPYAYILRRFWGVKNDNIANGIKSKKAHGWENGWAIGIDNFFKCSRSVRKRRPNPGFSKTCNYIPVKYPSVRSLFVCLDKFFFLFRCVNIYISEKPRVLTIIFFYSAKYRYVERLNKM